MGYDGRFVLYIALAPFDAESYIDHPAYRYTRILYPLLARTVVLGTPGAIPWALLAINVLAASLLALVVALYLRRLGVCPVVRAHCWSGARALRLRLERSDRAT